MPQTLVFLVVLLLSSNGLTSQSVTLETVAFYNVENLFDPIDDPDTYDQDYTPHGRYHWSEQLLHQKIDLLAEVIVHIGQKETGKPPLFVGLAEVENRAVLELLTAHPLLANFGYEIVHFDSPDARGIDVAFLYRKSFFILETVKTHRLNLVDPKTQHRRTTRDQLVLSGYWQGELLSFSVNHWPSRRGGQKRSQASRMAAAQLQLSILDSIQYHTPEAYVISMGDYNDNPTDKSLASLTQKNAYRQTFQPLFNPMVKLFKQGIGSLAHRDRWHLFDQVLLSQNWQSNQGPIFLKGAVFNPPFLRNPQGKFKGYPYRNQVNGTKLNGYSDHFPVYVIFGKKE